MNDLSKTEALPIAVVMPTLNAAAGVASALECVSGRVMQVIVVDGGSSDATQAIAAAAGASLVETERGRGLQLRAGGEAALRLAECAWLLFLHADTRLPPYWVEAVQRHMNQPEAEGKAAAFRLSLDDTNPAARRIERLADWRCRRLGLPYGDQGLLIHRELYRNVGGFKAMPLMEDVDFVRRIGRKRLMLLEAEAITSAERYRRDGYWMRPLRNLTLLGLYFLGVSPQHLVRWYG
jgi:rSAM/selenodomain-associated transferase 2